MHDVLSQLVMKWARFGPENRIDVCDDFTRLTLDTLGIAATDVRFNSFYKDELHPFPKVMGEVLTEAGRRMARPNIFKPFMRSSEKKYFDDIETMRSIAREIMDHRKAHPTDKKDLVNAMLNGRDPQTGLKMTDESVIDNMITFLIAGKRCSWSDYPE